MGKRKKVRRVGQARTAHRMPESRGVPERKPPGGTGAPGSRLRSPLSSDVRGPDVRFRLRWASLLSGFVTLKGAGA